jgi:hypothetical protein
MKKNNIYATAIACFMLAVSCESDKAVVEEVLEGKTSGGILRTLEQIPDDLDEAFDMFRTENTFFVTLEQQDETNGELIDRVDITVDFVDNNKTGSTGDDTNLGVAFATIPGSEFTVGDRGLPTSDFSYTMAEALTALGVDLTQVLPGDRIAINLELFFTDGRSFNAADAAVTVTGGSFFSSPFAYSLPIDDGIAFEYEVNTSDELDLSEGANNEDYDVSISIDDASEGSLLETLNVYRTFRDLTIGEDGTDLSEDEALFDTFTIADLDLEEGARTLDIVYTIDELLGDTVTLTDLAVGDDIQLRYEIVTADGRIVTTDENGTEYFYSIATSECVALDADGAFPGEYTVDMTDSYGDGWNGGFVSVFLGGVEVEGSPFRIETGDAATGTFTVPEGTTEALTATYTTADWDDENSFFILDPNGQKAAVEGPFPNTNGTGPFVYEVSVRVCE